MNSVIKNILLLMTKVIPLKKRIVFRSFNGHYSDSPKAISEKFHELYPDIALIWIVDKNNLNVLPKYVKGVDINSFKAVYYSNTSKVFVDNNYGRKGIVLTDGNRKSVVPRILCWLSSRKNQINLSTWHGTPLKKIGNDQPNSCGIDLISPPLIMVHPNEHTKNVLNRITFNRATNYVTGLPRNDMLFYEYDNEILKSKLGIPHGKKVVLYAPTFRSDGYDTDDKNVERSGLKQLEEIDFDVLIGKLKQKFDGEDWVFIGRFHYFVEKEVNWLELEKKYPGKILNGNISDDMSEYLAIADVLITDCSSCMFDYALISKPIFLYFPDIEHYRGVERGFYYEIDDLPFPCAKTYKELLLKIEKFDESIYKDDVVKMNAMLGAADNGKASEKIVDLIIQKSKWMM